MKFGVTVTKKPITAERISRYMNNGIAIGVTQTAKESQAAVIAGIEGGGFFKNRTPWFKQQSPIGIRITPASGDSAAPTASVHTKAYFGELQEKGGIKIPFGNHLAIPAKGGPLASLRRIPAELKPKALIQSGKGFIVIADSGTPIIMTHKLKERGRLSGAVIMYILVKRANIRATNFFEKPIETTARRRLGPNISAGVDRTLGRLMKRS